MTSRYSTATAPRILSAAHLRTASLTGRLRVQGLIKQSVTSRRTGIQVLARAAAILRALARHPEGLTLRAIAEQVNLPRSTVQRIVDALDHENLVLAAFSAQGVRLGPALVGLAAAAKFEIAALARPFLTALAKNTGETVDLSVLDHSKAVVIDQIAGIHRLRVVSAVGGSLPLHCSANGKALLASLREAELKKLRKRLKLARMTEKTIVAWEELERELCRIRQHDVAFDREEVSLGICAVGTALPGPTGELIAISVVVPTQRFEANEKALAKKLLACRRALRQRLEREPG